MFLSVYENKVEKRIDKILSKVKLGISSERLYSKLVDLFYEYPVEVTVWLEYKYKGYKFLKKKRRNDLYEVSFLIEDEFMKFYEARELDEVKIETALPDRVKTEEGKKQVWILMMIAEFLKGKYKYRESSAFWKLFPSKYGDEGVKMIGDCNQIVTLYIWLYGLVGDKNDLKIRVLPNHVCLHVADLDFEATVGGFKDYKNKGYLADCENIIAINLLDIHDPVEKRWDVSQVNTAKMQAVAAMFEVESELVEKNLKITYVNMGVFYLNQKKWKEARKLLEIAEAEDLIHMSYHNEVLELVDRKNFKSALKVAAKGGLVDLERRVRRDYCIRLADTKNWKKALIEARKLGNREIVRYVRSKEFQYLYDKVSGLETVKAARGQKSKYRRLLFLAKKLGDKKAEESVKRILRKI